MTIVKWAVRNWNDYPEKNEYEKETAHFYCGRSKSGSARRDAKISRYERYFDSELEALEFIADRNAGRARSKEIHQIQRHAVELLEAAERYLEFRHISDIGMGCEYSGVHPETQLKNVIAKAKGQE